MSKKIVTNKKAYFEYQILEKFIAGIQLQGSEVKSIKAAKTSIAEAHCILKDGELFVKGMHVTEHKEGGRHYNHAPVRDRKLLLKRKEINKLIAKTAQKGMTIVPLEVLVTPKGLVKLQIGLAKGKNLYDKRNSIKEKDLKRESERNL
jgi:SsrA-binding protein